MAKKNGPIEFWFDFSSPYAYLASTQIDDIAEEHGRTVLWKPFLVGAAMKVSGNIPLLNQPLKGDYVKRDAARFARLYGVDFTLPTPFPIASLAPTRAFYWLNGQNADKAKLFASLAFSAYYADGRDISQPDEAAAIAGQCGVDAGAALAAIATPEVKEMAKQATQEAIDKGVFGSPFIIADEEPFWGVDRLWMVEEWLETGGF